MYNLINFYISENNVTSSAIKNNSLNIFPKIVNNSMFDDIISQKNEKYIEKLIKLACTTNDLSLIKKIYNEYDLTKFKHKSLGNVANFALNYNSVDIFIFLYKLNLFEDNYFIVHGRLNPLLFEFLLKEKSTSINFHFLGLLVLNKYEITENNVKLMIKYNVDLTKERNDNWPDYLMDIDKDTSIIFLISILNTSFLDLIFDANYRNSNKKTILHYAIKKDKYFIVNHLIKKINVNEKDKNLTTPLHLACKFNNLDIVELLLLNGASQFLDIGKKPPIFYAVITGNLPIILLLLNYGADINFKDVLNKRLIDYAFEYKHFDVAEFLFYEKDINKSFKELKIN